MKHDKILVIGDGAVDTFDLARAVRKIGAFSEIKYLDNIKNSDFYDYIGVVVLENSESIKKDWEKLSNLPVLLVSKNLDGEFDTDSLEKFIINKCNLSEKWDMKTFVKYKIKELTEAIGDKKVLLGLSGGVDSSVAAMLLHEAIGDNLYCIFVDHGLLRKGEAEMVVDVFRDKVGLNLTAVDASDVFLRKLENVVDPEKKRKIIGEEFIRVFEDEAKKIGKVDYLAQGTIYPDIVESGGDGAKTVKSHHNVGGLPENIEFDKIIEPLSELFKDEVREAGEILGLDYELVWRQPFPGPGLAVRIVGDINKAKLNILKDADAIVREEIVKIELDKRPNQYFAVLCDIKSVGTHMGARSYEYTLAIRAVDTNDFMSAKWSRLDYELLDRMSSRICSEVEGINRVVYDISSKPPATIEWE